MKTNKWFHKCLKVSTDSKTVTTLTWPEGYEVIRILERKHEETDETPDSNITQKPWEAKVWIQKTYK